MTNATLRGKPDAGNPHARFDEGDVAPAKPRRGSRLDKVHKTFCCSLVVTLACLGGALAADDTERLQKLLDSGRREVVFPAGEFALSRPLVISGRTTLRCSPRTVVRLKDGANCPLLVNRCMDAGREGDITIEGGVWDGNNVGQDRAKYAIPTWNPKGQIICLAGITNLTLRGLVLKDPNSYCVMLTDIENLYVTNLVFDCNDKTENQDGLHLNGAVRHARIFDLRGHTNDDLLALNSDEGETRTPDCTIEDVVADGIDGGSDGYTAVRLLSRNAKVRNIRLRNICGEFKYYLVSFTHWAWGDDLKPGMGHFDDIVVENVTARCVRRRSDFERGLFWFQPNVQDIGTVTLRNIHRVEDAAYVNVRRTIQIGDYVKIRKLILDNVTDELPWPRSTMEIAMTAKVDEIQKNDLVFKLQK